MRASTDVIVAGLGVLGGATARALAQRGLNVVGLDRHRPPHRLGSSHGGSRIIRRIYAEGTLYVPLVERAYELWRELERETGASLLLPRGGLFLGAAGSDLVTGALACAGARGLDHELLSAAELRRRFPALRPPPGLTAVFDPAAGVLRPETCHESLLASAAAAGAELRFDCALERWASLADGVEVACGGRTIRARHLVLATGAWLADAGLAAGVELTVERQVQHWFEQPEGPGAPDEPPPFVWELSADRTWYAVPDLGEGVKVAMHRGGETTTAETVRRRVRPAEVEEVRRLLELYLPHAAGACRASRVCLYTNTPDLRFLAGPLPGEPRIWLVGGGSGHAFKFAPALGELAAEGIAERHIPPALAPFLPARLAL